MFWFGDYEIWTAPGGMQAGIIEIVRLNKKMKDGKGDFWERDDWIDKLIYKWSGVEGGMFSALR